MQIVERIPPDVLKTCHGCYLSSGKINYVIPLDWSKSDEVYCLVRPLISILICLQQEFKDEFWTCLTGLINKYKDKKKLERSNPSIPLVTRIDITAADVEKEVSIQTVKASR